MSTELSMQCSCVALLLRLMLLVALVTGSGHDAFGQNSVQPATRLNAHDVDTMQVSSPGVQFDYGTRSKSVAYSKFGFLRMPKGKGPFPLAIVVHGGCYFSEYATYQNTSALADALTGVGIATWNIEYPTYDKPGGGWPGTFDAVGEAADYVRTLANRARIDTNRIIAVGHSAGGQLALWLASRQTPPPRKNPRPIHVSGVVALGPITDMREFYQRESQTCGNTAIESVLGGPPDSVPGRVSQVSPVDRLPLGVPVVLIAGAIDGIAPRRTLDQYAKLARAKGDSVVIVTTPGEGHFEAIAPARLAGRAAIEAALRLTAKKGSSAPGRD